MTVPAVISSAFWGLTLMMPDSTLHTAYDNPFPPEDDAPLGLTADGEPYYEGEEIVELDGGIYRYDGLDADTILSALDIPIFTATKEY